MAILLMLERFPPKGVGVPTSEVSGLVVGFEGNPTPLAVRHHASTSMEWLRGDVEKRGE
jgi:hypothetical protein